MGNYKDLNSYKKRFQQLCEMTTYTNNLEEDGGNQDDMNQEPPMGGDPNAGGDMPPMGGGDPNAGGGMPPMGGGQDPSMGGGGPNAGGGMPPMGGSDPNAGGQTQPPQGFSPQTDEQGGGMPPMGGGQDELMGGEGEQPSEDDDVVDISQLTDAQDETKEQITHLDDKFGEIMKHIGAFEELLKMNDEKIEDLKSEFEKRNPTQVEKLGLQTTKSYPFNVTPDDFWKEKKATSNYSTEPDNNGKEQGQYVITKDDVNGAVDWKGIADSLDDDDNDDKFIYNQTLDGVLKI